MPRLTRFCRHGVSVCLLSAMLPMPACEPSLPEIDVVAQEFRFVPAFIRVAADQPVVLNLINEGRDAHEFQTPLLSRGLAQLLPTSELPQQPTADSVRIPPRHRIRLVVQPRAGTYAFRCRVKGHGGMEGTIIAE